MNGSTHVAVVRTVRRGAAGLLCALLAVTTWGQDPWGDYGDAPDSPIQHFPTIYATTNSRLGGPGVFHWNIGQEMLGIAVSGEFGATDPLDPDGMPNLVNQDSDDGLNYLLIMPYGAPFSVPLVRFAVSVDLTVAAGEPDMVRYLNILVDANRDQEWRNRGGFKEWVVVNAQVFIPPGTTQTVLVPLGIFPDPYQPTTPPLDMWMRMTLTRAPIDEASTVPQGGWDGSGAFEFGETEDYRLYYSTNPGGGEPGWTPDVPVVFWPPPINPCSFHAWCDPCVLAMDHCGGPRTLSLWVRVNPAGCGTANLRSWAEDPIGPIIGLGVVNGSFGAITNMNVVPLGDGGFRVDVTITPACDPPERIQSFGIKFRLEGFSGGSKVWAASKTCDVVIYHDWYQWGLLAFSAYSHPVGQPIPVYDHSGIEPLAYVVFGNEQPTSGTITVHRVNNLPGLAEDPDMLPVASFFDVQFDLPEYWQPGMPEVETQISGLWLTGYTDQMLAEKGILNENILEPVRMPYYGESFFDVFEEATDKVGEFWWLDPAANMIGIEHPYGFSVWGFRANFPAGDMNCDGLINGQDIDGFVYVLFGAPPYAQYYNWTGGGCNHLNADMNGDGLVNGQDIDGFVAVLFGG